MRKYIMILVSFLFFAGCGPLTMGRVGVSAPDEINGMYNLVMVGGTFAADAERLVILDAADDNTSFRPVTGPGRVKTVVGLTAAEALQRAEMFFSGHCAYDGYDIKKLNSPEAGFVGYELTPDYPASLCEDGNVLQVSYARGEKGEIKVYTWLLLKKDHGGSKVDMMVPDMR